MRLELKTRHGAVFDVPPTLANITTYVLLEQERWFEKELDFLLAWLRPEINVIDAEYHEHIILAGGRRFFARHSPLVMFEVAGSHETQIELIAAVEAIGYETFRSLPAAHLLLPRAEDEQVDEYELNLFAAKADRAASLERAGFLVRDRLDWSPDDVALQQGAAFLRSQPFAPAFDSLWSKPVDDRYRRALAGYASWRGTRNTAALHVAYRTMAELTAETRSLAYQSTFARIAWDAGWRGDSLHAIDNFRQTLATSPAIDAPFWPASFHFDSTCPSDSDAGDWFLASAFDHLVRGLRHSSRWSRPNVNLDWLAGQPWVPTEIERRRVLRDMFEDRAVHIPERLCRPARDHLNADAWTAMAMTGSFSSPRG